MPNGRDEELDDSFTKAFWGWVTRTYGEERAGFLREDEAAPEDEIRKLLNYFNKIVYPTLDYPELTGEALKEKRSYETAARFATYTGRVPKDWMLPLVTSYPEGFGGYEAGTVGFFKALAPEKWAEYEAESARLRKEEEEEKWQRQYAALPLMARMGPEAYRAYTRQRAWETQRVTPRYGRIFGETKTRLTGPEPWKEWFSSQFGRIASEFETTIPRFEERYWPGLTPKEVEKRVEETWAEYLKTPRFREEYATRYPFGMGGKPWAYQPRIQTVAF